METQQNDEQNYNRQPLSDAVRIKVQKRRKIFSFPESCGCGCLGGCLGLIAGAIAAIILPVIFLGVIVEEWLYMDDNVVFQTKNQQEQIYVIPVNGVLVRQQDDSFWSSGDGTVSAEELIESLKDAEQNPDVKAIILDMDTPGGEVVAADEVYRAVKQCSKPVVVMMNSLAASGGYYIACGADKIVAHNMTMTGSIGVIMETYNYAGLLDKIGVKPQIYTSGKMKAMLNGSGALPTEEQTKIVQNLIMEVYQEFARIVSENRQIPMEQITGGIIGDGRIFSGQQAAELKLVDRIGYFDDAVEEAAKLAGVKIENIRIRYHEDSYDLLRDFFKKSAFRSKTQQVELLLPNGKPGFQLTAGKPYLLPAVQQ